MLLALPGELRNEVFRFLIPPQETIDYQCSIGLDHGSLPRHESCGKGPGWSCLRDKDPRPLDVLRANRQLYTEITSLLYNKIFVIDVAGSPFFANSFDFAHFASFPWHKARQILLKIHVKSSDVFPTFFSCCGIANRWRESSLHDLRVEFHLAGVDKHEIRGVDWILQYFMDAKLSLSSVTVEHHEIGRRSVPSGDELKLRFLRDELPGVYDELGLGE